MISRDHLEAMSERQREIKHMQAAWNDEFKKYTRELFEKARDVLRWKDDNLGQRYLDGVFSRGTIHELRGNCVVLRFADTDPELPPHYYNVSFDEIYTEDWKRVLLERHEEGRRQSLINEQLAKEKAALELEQKERAEYERLRAKYG